MKLIRAWSAGLADPSQQAGGGIEIASGESRANQIWLLLVVGALLVFLGLGSLAGCASTDAEDTSSSTVEEPAPEHESITLRVATPVGLQGVVEELTDAYAADKDWLSFDVQAYESAKKQNAAITPSVPATAAGGESASGADVAPDDNPALAPDDEAFEMPFLPEAEIVFESSRSAMNSAEKLGAADPLTRADMLEDRMVIVASADAALSSATTANIEAGSYPIAVVSGKSAHATRQYEVLEALGVYSDGAFAGYYATSANAVHEYENTADLFAAVSKSDDMVALVKESDLYRFGGVKVVGAVPARMYTAMRYPQALGENLSLLERGDAIEESARDFFSWMTTDEAALRIIEKWGLHFAA